MNSRRLNAYEKRKAARALKRRERYAAEKQLRMFEKSLEDKFLEQRLKDAQAHEKELRDET